MTNSWQKLKGFLTDESGPTAAEYAILLALIILVCLIGIKSFGQATSDNFTDTSNSLSTHMGN